MDNKEFNLLLDEVSEQLDRITAQLNHSGSEPQTTPTKEPIQNTGVVEFLKESGS